MEQQYRLRSGFAGNWCDSCERIKQAQRGHSTTGQCDGLPSIKHRSVLEGSRHEEVEGLMDLPESVDAYHYTRSQQDGFWDSKRARPGGVSLAATDNDAMPKSTRRRHLKCD